MGQWDYMPPNNDPISNIQAKRAQQAQFDTEEARNQSIIDAVNTSGADTKDSLTSSMHDILMATMIGKDPRIVEVATNLSELLQSIATASDEVKNSGLKDVEKTFKKLLGELSDLPKKVAATDQSKELIPFIQAVEKAIRGININPSVTVNEREQNLKPVTELLKSIEKAVKENKVKVDLPKQDTSELEKDVQAVTRAIKGLSFPVPNYVLPFRNTQGAATQITAVTSTSDATKTGLIALNPDGSNISGGGGSGGTQYAELVTTAPATGTVALARYKSSAPTLTDGQLYAPQLDVNGNLKVAGTFSASPASSVVSTVNSSTTPLAISGVFTGTSEEVKDYAIIVVSVISNVASVTDGLSVQQSSDGTNWDITDTYTIPAASGKTFTFQPGARYFRIVYTNGGTIQASFRLQTIYHYSVTKTSSQRATDGYTNETDLEQQQAFNMLYNGTTWDRFRGDTTNGLDVDVTRMSALVAGSAVVGKVGIDQTTPGTTNLVALAANQSVNNTQIVGTAIDVNSGNKSAGTQRMVIATDQPNLTTPLNVALAANQSTNIAQVNAATVNVGVGAAGTGTQRVTTSTDSTIGTVTTLTGTTTLTPGTGATNLGKAEDAIHSSGDVGVMALAVANTGAATAFAASGDYTPISVDLNGVVFTRTSPANTATLSNVAGSVTSVTLIAANTSRRTVIIYNDSTSDLYVKYGSTASATSFTYYVPSLGTLSFDGNEYAGIVTGIWISATGNARVTEVA